MNFNDFMTSNTVKGYVLGSAFGWIMSRGQKARERAEVFVRDEGLDECAVPGNANAVLFYMPVLFGTIGASVGFVQDCGNMVSNYVARPNNRR